jgi:hypothetical protein
MPSVKLRRPTLISIANEIFFPLPCFFNFSCRSLSISSSGFVVSRFVEFLSRERLPQEPRERHSRPRLPSPRRQPRRLRRDIGRSLGWTVKIVITTIFQTIQTSIR